MTTSKALQGTPGWWAELLGLVGLRPWPRLGEGLASVYGPDWFETRPPLPEFEHPMDLARFDGHMGPLLLEYAEVDIYLLRLSLDESTVGRLKQVDGYRGVVEELRALSVLTDAGASIVREPGGKADKSPDFAGVWPDGELCIEVKTQGRAMAERSRHDTTSLVVSAAQEACRQLPPEVSADVRLKPDQFLLDAMTHRAAKLEDETEGVMRVGTILGQAVARGAAARQLGVVKTPFGVAELAPRVSEEAGLSWSCDLLQVGLGYSAARLLKLVRSAAAKQEVFARAPVVAWINADSYSPWEGVESIIERALAISSWSQRIACVLLRFRSEGVTSYREIPGPARSQVPVAFWSGFADPEERVHDPLREWRTDP